MTKWVNSQTVRRELGPVAVIRRALLPKTRSGKITRRVLKAVALAGLPPRPATGHRG